MKKLMQKVTGVALATLMAASSAGLGVFAAEDGADKIVNIGVTDSLGGVNPLMMDQTEINKYAADLQFLPLVELDPELNFQPMLADSVTTEDNQTFTVHIDDAATWSDGTPVTAEDVEFTILRLASPVVNNTTMMLYAFEGIGDDGFTEEGAASIDGIKVVDDKTITFTAKSPMALTTFENTYGRYIHTLPKHVLADYSDEELMTLDWFNHPDVISGPYFLTDYDTDHYVSYEANADYWKGAPKIGKLNLKIVEEGNEQTDADSESDETDDAGTSNTPTKRKKEKAAVDDDGYQVFKMPWSINLSTGFNITEDTSRPINRESMRYPYKFSLNALNINGNVKISNKWAVSFNSGYDFNAKKIVQTSFNITRDLHCFSMSASLSPFGTWKYYSFVIRANASILQDLKYDKKSQTQTNIKWY